MGLGVEARRETREGPQKPRLPWSVGFVGILHAMWGVALLLGLFGIVFFVASGDQEMAEFYKGRTADTWNHFFLALLAGVANILGGHWVWERKPAGRWLAALCALHALALGFVASVQSNVDAFAVIGGYMFPLLSLYVLQLRHRSVFERNEARPD